MPPNCKKCGGSHFNFQSCAEQAQASREKRNRDEAMLKPPMTPPPGYHWLDPKPGRTVKQYGDTIVSESGLKLRTGKLTYPEGVN